MRAANGWRCSKLYAEVCGCTMMDDDVVDTDDNNGVDDMDGDEWKDDDGGDDDNGDGNGDGHHDDVNDRRCRCWRWLRR